MTRPPSQKGISVLPVVVALKQRPDARRIVPAALWKYFDEPVLISGWYPERDYWILMEALVKTIDPASVGGDVWRFFARFSAQRDIAGRDGKPSPAGTTEAKGVYRTFASGGKMDAETFFRRAIRLWSQYHDSGRLEIVGGRRETNAVVMRLTGFHIPIEGFVRLQGYYLEEYGRLVGIELESTVTHSTVRGAPYCEWEHKLAPVAGNDEYVASLPDHGPLRRDARRRERA